MSRIGKKPVIIPANVTVDIAEGNAVTVKGPKGTLSYTFHPDMILKVEGNVLTVERHLTPKGCKLLWREVGLRHEREGLDGLLADLGVSSHHFDDETRGFSFRYEDAPLDMRMNKRAGKTAADIVNDYEESQLADIFYLYGELKNSRRIASALVKARATQKIVTTTDFIKAVEPLFKKEREKKEV